MFLSSAEWQKRVVVQYKSELGQPLSQCLEIFLLELSLPALSSGTVLFTHAAAMKLHALQSVKSENASLNLP